MSAQCRFELALQEFRLTSPVVRLQPQQRVDGVLHCKDESTSLLYEFSHHFRWCGACPFIGVREGSFLIAEPVGIQICRASPTYP